MDIALVKADVPGNAVFRNYRYRLETSEYVVIFLLLLYLQDGTRN